MSAIIIIEGGGTRTRAAVYDDGGTALRALEGGPSNPAAYGVDSTARCIASLARQALGVSDFRAVRVYAALAGVFNGDMRRAVASALGRRLRPLVLWVAPDLHTMLCANAGSGAGVLVIAGTGAALLAQDGAGKIQRTGGWGVLFGDEGSAYAVAVAALRACARACDGVGPDTALVQALPASAGLASFQEFIGWSARAGKGGIAALAPAVAATARDGDRVACACIEDEADKLAALVEGAAKKLGLTPDVPVFEYGGLLEHCELFRHTFRNTLRRRGITPTPCIKKGREAVYCLAEMETPPPWVSVWTRDAETGGAGLSATEMTDVGILLDALSVRDLVARMHGADEDAVAAAGEATEALAAAVERAARSLQEGGRIIYAGAGTSGRLGVLDASECPPTFGAPPERVCGLIAGGDRALRFSVEGAEDDRAQGAADVRALQVTARDFVAGIAASGNTPYVGGVLEAARAAGAATALITSNPDSMLEADIRIVMNTGPEVLAGSTRLKAGTAAKLALNTISTGAFTLAGYVYRGRMVGMIPANEKLRGRAARIVAELGGATEARAAQVLEESGYHIATAILMLRRRLTRQAATRELDRHEGNLRQALADVDHEES